MTKPRPISQKIIDDAGSLVEHVYSSKARKFFEQSYEQNDVEAVVTVLSMALSSSDEDGLPRGKKGLPTQRAAAEAVVRSFSKGSPSRG